MKHHHFTPGFGIYVFYLVLVIWFLNFIFSNRGFE